MGDHVATSQILPQFKTKPLRLMFSENYPIRRSYHPSWKWMLTGFIQSSSPLSSASLRNPKGALMATECSSVTPPHATARHISPFCSFPRAKTARQHKPRVKAPHSYDCSTENSEQVSLSPGLRHTDQYSRPRCPSCLSPQWPPDLCQRRHVPPAVGQPSTARTPRHPPVETAKIGGR